MLNAYVRRQTGDTEKINWTASGQYLSVRDGKVRLARLDWDTEGGVFAEEVAGPRALLLATVPLVDVLILTRAVALEERAVFHGLVTEANGDSKRLSLVAVDDPATERLFEQTFDPRGPLLRSDVPPPAAAPAPTLATPFPPGQAPAPGAVPEGYAADVTRVRSLSDPAARPGGRPTGRPQQATAEGFVPVGDLSARRRQ